MNRFVYREQTNEDTPALPGDRGTPAGPTVHVHGSGKPLAGAATGERRVLKAGGIGNALVYLVSRESVDWVVKDFSQHLWPVRRFLGPLLIHREAKTLRRLAGLPGVPAEAVRLGPMTLAYRFTDGETLSAMRKRKAAPDAAFFVALEQLVSQLHQRGFVHLDLRNSKNILVTPDQRPHLLDFQSGLWTSHLPALIRRRLERIDHSGVYKWWNRLAPASLDPERRAVLDRVNRRRLLWPFNQKRKARKPAPRRSTTARPTAA